MMDAFYCHHFVLPLHLPVALARSRPDAVIYLAGADPCQGDHLALLALTKAGSAERDRHVLTACRGRGLPLAVTMAGGYAGQVQDIVDIHSRTAEQTAEFAASY